MARQTGLVKIKGTLGELTFYSTSTDGYLVRQKGGITSEKMANDPAFARARETAQEFGAASSAGKLLCDSFRSLMLGTADNHVISRITKTMIAVLKLDTVNERGKRVPAQGITTQEGKDLLKGFDFNTNAPLNTILHKPFALNPATGTISITDFLPVRDIAAPAGATHVSFTGAFGNINFEAKTTDFKTSNMLNIALNASETNIVLSPTEIPVCTGNSFYLLKIEFFQLVNGVQYSLQNGSFNALGIIEVV